MAKLNIYSYFMITSNAECLNHNIINMKNILAYLSLSGDGTFTYCEKHFHQLFNIHTQQNIIICHRVFFLPNKKSPTYEIMLQFLKELCINKDQNILHEKIIVIFETAVHGSSKT